MYDNFNSGRWARAWGAWRLGLGGTVVLMLSFLISCFFFPLDLLFDIYLYLFSLLCGFHHSLTYSVLPMSHRALGLYLFCQL
ncbi:hypothetical protein B0J18DRAFT_217253 [Chaetomium sp. MPI-SDFR-AT-0129]|nr:hypothetical protein B0J18DRAFT_217253 [Chaetomium sp. MPI-SDFR-AT-0129]